MMFDKKNILVVDDRKTNIDILLELLDPNYAVIPTLSGKKALEIVKKKNIDLILLDIMMPDMDGFEVCRILKEDEATKDIPIIFTTAKTDSQSIEKAFDAGGIDYISKPFNHREISSRITAHLSLYEQKKLLKSMKDKLQKENILLTKEIRETQREVVFTMGSIAELRSKETGNHVKRVAKYSQILALHYGLSEEEAAVLEEASPMHDIGKVAIPDDILNKPGRHTVEEFKIMKGHARLGYEMIKDSERPLMKTASIVAHEHHEKWDGSGYPRGLSGENIHIYGRITAIADVFDALGSERAYKKAWDDEKIFTLLKEEKGKHFDPTLIDIFFKNLDEILVVRDKFVDLI